MVPAHYLMVMVISAIAWLQMHNEWKPKVRAYLLSISFAGMLAGKLLNALKEQGSAGNAIVVVL